MASCPPPEVLGRFGSGSRGDAADSSLDAHINGCSACQSALDRLAHEVSDTTGTGTGRVAAPEDLPRIPGFELERELGRGGMGVVYLAKERNADRAVAVKFTPSGPLAAPRDRERWLREARAAARVRHPHIVRLYRADESGGWLYLVLEYVPGGSLKEHLTGPVPPRLAATLLLPIAEALEALHRAGIWHLDLKPANILVDAAPGSPLDRAPLKLTDFGIARSCDEPDPTGSRPGAAPGTLLYMAPEQVAGRRSALGPATDIHAMGVILYELVTGRPPFLAGSDVEMMQQIQAREPVPPRQLNPRVPRDLETICLKCLEKAADRRYATAEALAEDFGRFLDGRPISARPVARIEKTWRWCRRRPAIASLIAVLALSLAGGLAGSLALWRLSEARLARVEIERAQADAARRLAEQNERLASRTLDELSGVLFAALEHPETLSEDRIFELVHFLRQQARDSRNSRGLGPWCVPGVGVLERVLACKLFDRGQRAEARSLLADSVAYLKECRRLAPDDQKLLRQLGHALLNAGHLAARDSALDAAAAFYDQSSAVCGALVRLSDRVELADDLYQARQGVAMQLIGRGESARARRLMESARRSFLLLEAPDADRSRRVLPEGGAPEYVEAARCAAERLQAALQDSPADRQLRGFVERYVTDLVVATVMPFPWEAGLSGESNDPNEPEASAEPLLSSFRSRCRALGLDERLAPNVALKLADLVTIRAAEQRRIGRLGDADGTVRGLMVFAWRLVRDHPDQPESHMILSVAYLQVSKNAWKREDYPAIERALRQSLKSARHARDLDPRHEGARLLVEKIAPRLALFDAGRATPK